MLQLAYLLVGLVNLLYYVRFFRRLRHIPPCSGILPGEEQGVSIVICARNEAAHLEAYLPVILAQVYPGGDDRCLYEVVVVDDNSTDNTAAVLQALKSKFAHLTVVALSGVLPAGQHGKKAALVAGVAAARYNWLLMTDADCKPAGEEWLCHMVVPLAKGYELVAGYGGYHRLPGLLNKAVQWETLNTFMQYAAYALAGTPYMAVGRNLACTRAAFERASSDPRWKRLPYGDDDMLVSLAGAGRNMAVVACQDAFTWSEAKATWREWVQQKQRHLSTGKYYRLPVRLLLGGYAVAHALFWLLSACLLFVDPPLMAVVFTVRCLLYWAAWAAMSHRLKTGLSLIFLPLFDAGWIIYNFAFLPFIAWKNKKTWK